MPNLPTDAAEPNLNEAREIKVKLPVSLHIKLHGIKITRHRSISQVVLEALEEYFRRMENGKVERRE
ncbi:MAG TPA: hypothetical protein VI818_06180 [Candidatus Thermoplasmatota archaeon]|nr:hypothetical protein [Candidatus Thermoplasmatota archaeon]